MGGNKKKTKMVAFDWSAPDVPAAPTAPTAPTAPVAKVSKGKAVDREPLGELDELAKNFQNVKLEPLLAVRRYDLGKRNPST